MGGGQRHIASEICTDVAPERHGVSRGGPQIDGDIGAAEAACRLRCYNLCQPTRFWLIDNGSDFVRPPSRPRPPPRARPPPPTAGTRTRPTAHVSESGGGGGPRVILSPG